jgi:predicted RNA-binding protein with PIN domain
MSSSLTISFFSKGRSADFFVEKRLARKHFGEKRAVAAETGDKTPERAVGDAGHGGAKKRRINGQVF